VSVTANSLDIFASFQVVIGYLCNSLLLLLL